MSVGIGELLLYIGAPYAGRDGGEKLVGDGTGTGSLLLKEVGGTEEDDFIAFAAGDVGDIKEAHVHAHRADDGHLAAPYKYTPVAIA